MTGRWPSSFCRACVARLDIDGASISLLTAGDARETLCATDATAELLEDLQFSLGEGACVEAASTGRPVLVADLHHSTETSRWPVFAAAVAERSEVGALFAVPLQWGTVNLGVLDLYRATPGSLSDAQLRDAIRAADLAALMFLGVRTDPGDGVWAGQLQRRVAGRRRGRAPAGRLPAHPAVVASSNEDVKVMELLQLEAGEGPCVECFRTGAPVSVADLTDAADRWPAFVAAVAQREAFRSVHALPLRLRGEAIGAMNLFRHDPVRYPRPTSRWARHWPTWPPSGSCPNEPSGDVRSSPSSSRPR